MKDAQKQIELAELIQKELDGLLTDQEFLLLQSILKKDAEAIDYYVKTIFSISAFSTTLMTPLLEQNADDLQGNLSDSAVWRALAESERTAPCIEIPKEPEPSKELIQNVKYERIPNRVNKTSLYLTIASLAAMLCMIVYVSLNPRIQMQAIAELTDSIDAKWGNSAFAVEKGGVVYNTDDFRFLSSGIIKLEYNYGTEVIIEGPARFRMPSEDELELQAGKVFSRVPENATGFTVVSPTASVIDLGTEFGVQVDVDGTSNVCLFKGKASLIAGRKGQTGESRALEVGNAKHIDQFARVHDTGDVSTLFAREISSSTHTVWRGEPLSLASFVAGGDGFTDGNVTSGIDPSTGLINSQVIQEYERFAEQAYLPVPNRRFVDGVFAPNGLHGENVVTSAGHRFAGFPPTDSYYWSDITSNPTAIDARVDEQGKELIRKSVRIFLDEEHGNEKNQRIIFLHSNAGITFDLREIRKAIPKMEITRFIARCGTPFIAAEQETYAVKQQSEFWVLVDGECVFHHKRTENTPGIKEINIPLAQENQFLTLAATDGGDEIKYDWCIFANPSLEIEVKSSSKVSK